MEEKKRSKWLMGCGIGCGAVVVILVILGIVGYNFFKSKFGVYEELEIIEDKLVEQYGGIDEYCPPPDGNIPPYRLERFLRVRESMQESAGRFADQIKNLESLDALQSEQEKPTIRTVFKMIGGGFDFASQLGTYYKELYESLLLNEMGLGEYLYIYVLGYYSYLGSAPDTGIWKGPESGVLDEEDFRDMHRDGLMRMNRHLQKILRCQFESIPEETPLKESLAVELAKMNKNPIYLPWQDDLPDPIRETFDPYRDQLAETFDQKISHFELFFSSFGKGENKEFRFNFND